VFAGKTADAAAHRKRILALAGTPLTGAKRKASRPPPIVLRSWRTER
jgi:hypothetical protein